LIKLHYTPTKEIFVHDLRKHSVEEFIHNYITPRAERVGWAGDCLLWFSHFGTSDLLIQKALDGEEHISCIDYCMFGEYQPVLKNDAINLTVLVIDQSKDKIIKKVIELINVEEAKNKVEK